MAAPRDVVRCVSKFVFALTAAAASLGTVDEGVAPRAASAPALPASVDLRAQLDKWGLGPRSQGKRNTCSVFTAAAALEFALSRHLDHGTPLSPEYLNWACNQVIGNKTQDRGQFFHDLLKGFDRLGACPEASMPYQPRFEPDLSPSAEATRQARAIRAYGLRIHWINPWKPQPGLTDEHLHAIRQVLSNGYPVAAGSSHSRLLVGYREDAAQPGGGVFYTKDSGAAAYTTVTYEFVLKHVGDVFWVEPPTPPVERKPPGAPASSRGLGC